MAGPPFEAWRARGGLGVAPGAGGNREAGRTGRRAGFTWNGGNNPGNLGTFHRHFMALFGTNQTGNR
jgi:hypothetical protein